MGNWIETRSYLLRLAIFSRMKKVVGICTLLSILSLITMLYLAASAPKEGASAIYIQSSLFLLFSSVALIGLYAIQAFRPDTNPIAKLAIRLLAAVLIVLGALVSYNLIDFMASVNWLISLGVIFLLLVQIQLIGVGKTGGIIPKIASFLIIVSNVFLAIFFITTMDYAGLKIWIHTAVLASTLSFILGMIFSPKAEALTE